MMRRAVRGLLVPSKLEEKRLREAGAGAAWEDAIDEWIDRKGMVTPWVPHALVRTAFPRPPIAIVTGDFTKSPPSQR